MIIMKKQTIIFIIFGVLTIAAGCKKWLDVNSDPDTPQHPDPASVFPTQLAGIPRGIQFDARYIGRYIQNWNTDLSTRTADINWDNMGYTANSDTNGDIWRQAYFGLGQNLNYIINVGRSNGQWDYVGAAFALKAYMFQICTDQHGEIIYTEAFRENTAIFRFDGQDTVYTGVRELCDSALMYLQRTDLNPSKNKLERGDYVYSGDVNKWIRFVYGILAHNAGHLSNKTGIYNPDEVIDFCNKSLLTIQDDFLIPFDASKNDDTNFFGPYRNNLTNFRQSNLIVQLLDGTLLAGSNVIDNRDPRIRHLLSASQDTTNGNGGYRGVTPGAGDPNYSSSNPVLQRQRVAAPFGDSIYGNPSANVFTPNSGKYLFRDKVVSPVMTCAEIFFIKAEAAYRKGDMATALEAYTQGINAHFDFINRTVMPRNNNQLYNNDPISAAARAQYMNGANVKRTAETITLRDIMFQKYIALWGWGFVETWADLRRFDYVEGLDPKTGLPVYLGFELPATLSADNQGKLVYRARPRFNSEYVWNRDELARIGALEPDYHTEKVWFVLPN